MDTALWYSFLFLLFISSALLFILWQSKYSGIARGTSDGEPSTSDPAGNNALAETPLQARAKEMVSLPKKSDGLIPPEAILEWEFEYARTTASEAMEDRHKIINFYLLVAGVVASGVLANQENYQVGTLILWCFCILGGFYFLSIIRLREAWHESLLTMLDIKHFCIDNAQDMPTETLINAFRWRRETLPAPEKKWSLYHYSALLIGFLNSVAFVAGGYLLSLYKATASARSTNLQVLMGVIFFSIHVSLYKVFLQKRKV